MYVEDIMQTNPTTVHRDAELREAIEVMASRHMQTLLVVDDDGRFVGEITAAQLAKVLLARNARTFIGDHPDASADETLEDVIGRLSPFLDRKVADFVDHDVPSVHPRTPLTDALLLLRGGAMRMPVTDEPGDRLVGAVSVLTVLRRVAQGGSG